MPSMFMNHLSMVPPQNLHSMSLALNIWFLGLRLAGDQEESYCRYTLKDLTCKGVVQDVSCGGGGGGAE